MILQILILLALFAFIFKSSLVIYWRRRQKLLPPGPWPLPVIGNGLEIDRKRPAVSFSRLIEKHGKIFSFMKGSQLSIFISDLKILKSAFKDDRLSGRPKSFFIYMHIGVENAIAFNEGPLWKERRQFAVQTLKKFTSSSAIDSIVQLEAEELVEALRHSVRQPVSDRVLFATATANTMASLLIGKRFDKQQVEMLIRNVTEVFSHAALSGPIDLFPVTRFIPPFSTLLEKMRSKFLEVFEMLQPFIDEHRQKFDSSQTPVDFIEAFFLEQEKGNNPRFTDRQLLQDMSGLFFAGLETTASSLQWAMVYMINYPDVQRKVQTEIDHVIGRSRPISSTDTPNLPYLEATVLEIFRLSAVLPFFLPHKAMEEVELEGYVIPKGSNVIGLNFHMSRDPDVWVDPEDFNPERFLDDSGHIDQTVATNVVAFSFGKRLCIGEQLATKEIFILLGSVIQSFTIVAADALVLSTEPHFGLTVTPQPYRFRAIPR